MYVGAIEFVMVVLLAKHGMHETMQKEKKAGRNSVCARAHHSAGAPQSASAYKRTKQPKAKKKL